MNMRVGNGYDVHRLVPDRDLILCGTPVPSEVGLLGHSDADVATHAIMDAILGAAGKTNSLNASNAAAVMMYEVRRRRELAR